MKPTRLAIIFTSLPLIAFAACYEPYTETGCASGSSGSLDHVACPNGTVQWTKTIGRFNTARSATSGKTGMEPSTSSCEQVVTYSSISTSSGEQPDDRSIFTTVSSNAAVGSTCSI